jgi:hypothetical protein
MFLGQTSNEKIIIIIDNSRVIPIGFMSCFIVPVYSDMINVYLCATKIVQISTQ